MEVEEPLENPDAKPVERRVIPRFAVDQDATMLLVSHGSSIPCRILDLSLGGCLMRTRERFTANSQLRVEVSFRVRGFLFRLSGVTQWSDGSHRVGIRFLDMSSRRKEELAEALGEVEEEIAAKALLLIEELPAIEAEAQRTSTIHAVQSPVVELPRVLETAQVIPVGSTELNAETVADLIQAVKPFVVRKPDPTPVAPPHATPAPALPKGRDRRSQSRCGVDSSAIIHLINIASRLNGRILDLSANGCRIETEQRFPVGIYTRVEVEFGLEGLPFRLGGVVQSIHNRNQVGIRFLDLSERKREQVAQLIEELEKDKV
jgi:c-di-GMP-binding flagellar brake protein YcgR